jgi:hypothetical protein
LEVLGDQLQMELERVFKDFSDRLKGFKGKLEKLLEVSEYEVTAKLNEKYRSIIDEEHNHR